MKKNINKQGRYIAESMADQLEGQREAATNIGIDVDKSIKALRKKTYPKINGKQLDEVHRREFDAWVEEYKWVIQISRPELTEEQVSVCAYNCAFSTVTNSIYKFN